MEDDAELYRAALAGGSEAFAPIVERYADAVFGIALARVGDFHDAQDVAQQVFVEAFERLDGLRDPARLGAWLRSITIHRAIDRVRQRRDSALIDPDMRSSDVESPQRQLERRELRAEVLAAVGRLSKTLRETTTLFYINGYSVDEVAGIQDVPAGTVKRRLHDARTRLKEEMIAMVEDVLKSESPREEIARQVYEMLQRYDKPSVTQERWEEIREKLLEIGTDGIEGFVRALECPHSPTRRLAVGLLSETAQSEETVEKLLKEATRDSNKKVRREAFRALFEIAWRNEERRQDLVPHILPALHDRSNTTRRLFAWYLAHFPGFARHVPLEEVAWAVVRETEKEPVLLRSQHDLLEAVLCLREGRENPHERFY